jgi:hypothetical protein
MTPMLRKVIHRDNITVVKLGYDSSFSLEPGQETGILTKRGVENLDSDISIEGGVIGLENGSHAASPKLLNNAIWAYILADIERHLASSSPPWYPDLHIISEEGEEIKNSQRCNALQKCVAPTPCAVCLTRPLKVHY